MDDEALFLIESRSKKFCYVNINETVVKDETYVIHIDLGSCVSVILCGIDEKRKAWFGVNHLFKYRVENNDMALEQVADLYNNMTDQGARHICCLGLFGAGYREKSLAKSTAQRNVLTVMEALSLYNLNVEIFQTGFSQGIGVLKSDTRDSFLIRHQNLDKNKTHIIEIPLIQLFR
jgi:chemotaxis receptor (MCP) glutamine deamidase CheD